MTVTGRTIAENLSGVKWNPDQDVVRRRTNPTRKTGGVVGLRGNLAPEGAIVKVAGMSPTSWCFAGRPVCSTEKTPVLRRCSSSPIGKAKFSSFGTRGREGPRRCAKCSRPPRHFTDRAWATRSRSSPTAGSPGATRGFCIGHVGPEAAVGGPIALLRDGDVIAIDAVQGASQCRPVRRGAAAAPCGVARTRKRGWRRVLWKYGQTVGSAKDGAVTHPGAAYEKQTYADI